MTEANFPENESRPSANTAGGRGAFRGYGPSVSATLRHSRDHNSCPGRSTSVAQEDAVLDC